MNTPTEFPDDENGQVLSQMQEDGDDLSKAREIEFFFVFENEATAREFAQKAGRIDRLAVTVSFNEDREIWQAVCVMHMAPEHVTITRLESKLTVLADEVDGTPEGWGCMQVD